MSKDEQLRDEEPRVVVRDKRRIDPESGEVRPVAAPAAPDDPTGFAAATDPAAPAAGQWGAADEGLLATIDERTADLQRLKAEFDNYRKRVERDRVVVAEQARGAVVAQLVPVLDDIDRARAHDEVTGGFKVVADALEAVVGKLGLERFGDEGDPFDPSLHEAVMHSQSPDVDGPTCVSVMRSGYRFAGRVLRPAMVAVAEPAAAGTLDDSLLSLDDPVAVSVDDPAPQT